jgi:hypothetical protein
MGHLLMENRNGLIVDALVTQASGTAEREAAEAVLGRQTGRHRAALGAEKGYDAADFIARVRALNVTPHIAQNTSRRPAIDGRTTRHPGYEASQRVRKRIEEAFGWIETTGGLRKTRHHVTERVGWMFTLTAAACTWSGCPSRSRPADHARNPPRAPPDGLRRRPGTPGRLAESPFYIPKARMRQATT